VGRWHRCNTRIYCKCPSKSESQIEVRCTCYLLLWQAVVAAESTVHTPVPHQPVDAEDGGVAAQTRLRHLCVDDSAASSDSALAIHERACCWQIVSSGVPSHAKPVVQLPFRTSTSAGSVSAGVGLLAPAPSTLQHRSPPPTWKAILNTDLDTKQCLSLSTFAPCRTALVAFLHSSGMHFQMRR
jgi:hypothetical protein